MRILTFAVAAISCALPLTGLAHADIVQPGTTFDVLFVNESSLASVDYSVTTGTPFAFTYGSGNGTITESEQFLGGQAYSIDVLISSNGDIFPGPTGDEIVIGVGSDDPIKMTQPLDLSSAVLTYRVNGTVLASSDYIGVMTDPSQFFGSFPGGLRAVNGGNFTGAGINQIELVLTGTTLPATVTPEPSALVLMGTGALSLFGLRRRFVP